MTIQSLPRSAPWLGRVRCIASDMDGTMTLNGRFHPALLTALEKAAAHGISVLLVTGRSAGWVQGLAGLMPISGAIAENGGIFFGTKGEDPGWELTAMPAGRSAHKQSLGSMFKELQSRFPSIQEAPDNAFRVTDWTFDVHGLTRGELDTMALLCREHGFDFTYSNVQCHILPGGQSKQSAVLQVMARFPALASSPAEVVTIGDSPNDESLFDHNVFPHSVGVANLSRYIERLIHVPQFVTESQEGNGFAELVDALVSSRLSH